MEVRLIMPLFIFAFIIIIKPTRKWGSSFQIFGGKHKQAGGLIFPSEWDPISYTS